MDPFTALGLAAAAVQFFDFTTKLFKEYRQQRDHAKVVTEEAFEAAARDLEQWVDALGEPPKSGRRKAKLMEQELALRQLAGKCGNIARKLLDTLKELKPRAKQSRWTSLAQAIRTMWKAEDIIQLRHEINLYRDQISIRVLACLNEKMNLNMETMDLSFEMQKNEFGWQRDQLGALRRGNDEIIGVLSFNHEELHKAILELKSGTAKTIAEEPEDYYESSFKERSRKSVPYSMMTLRAGLWNEDGAEAMFGDPRLIHHHILRCLHFRQISDRLDSVKEAHSSTFKWIFETKEDAPESFHSFPEWLEKSSGCYWIQGKAGSGKSTLMKKIYSHKCTLQYLSRWAQNLPLITASFFFWHLGLPLQKSQDGLLRSMLYHLLQRNPALALDIMPELFMEASKLRPGEMLEEPSRTELVTWFRRVGKACGSSSKLRVCYFIDGLDEYVGDHADLASLFLNLSRETTAIKFVLSSRPLSVFTGIFSELPGLRVQDLTRDDIKAYTIDLLKSRSLFVGGAQMKALVDEIARKSCGVFLWVVVVVRSVLEGLRDGDLIEELLERVDKMPSELEKLYRHMLHGIPIEYQPQAAQMLQLVAANFTGSGGTRGRGFIYPLPAIQLSFALESCAEALSAPIKSCKADEEAMRIKQVEARTRSRCLGLIELRNPQHLTLPTETFHGAVVEPFHRTAMEFLGDPDVAIMLRKLTSISFNPYLSLFCSTIRMAKISPSVVAVGTDEYDTSPYRHLRPALMIARSADLRGKTIPASYLDELDRVLTTHWTLANAYKRAPEADVCVANGDESISHWFSLMLKEKLARDHSVKALNKNPCNQGGGQKALKQLHSNAFPSAAVDPSLRRQLLLRRPSIGLIPVLLIFPMTTYLDDYLSRTALSKGDLNLLLSYLVQRQFNIHFDDFELDNFTTRTEAAFKSLLNAGADPNAENAAVPAGSMTPWMHFLVSVKNRLGRGDTSWEPDENQSHVLESVIKSFVSHGASLTAKVCLASNQYTPEKLLGWLCTQNQANLVRLRGLIDRSRLDGEVDYGLLTRRAHLEALGEVLSRLVKLVTPQREEGNGDANKNTLRTGEDEKLATPDEAITKQEADAPTYLYQIPIVRPSKKKSARLRFSAWLGAGLAIVRAIKQTISPTPSPD